MDVSVLKKAIINPSLLYRRIAADPAGIFFPYLFEFFSGEIFFLLFMKIPLELTGNYFSLCRFFHIKINLHTGRVDSRTTDRAQFPLLILVHISESQATRAADDKVHNND